MIPVDFVALRTGAGLLHLRQAVCPHHDLHHRVLLLYYTADTSLVLLPEIDHCLSRFVQLGYGRTEYFTWEDTVTDPSVIALSFYSGLFSYTGWNYLNFIIEEMKVIAKMEKKSFFMKLLPRTL